jgi:hypothetical protein
MPRERTISARCLFGSRALGPLAWLALNLTGACGSEELGECDPTAAEELVYDRSGMVATKGQALVHDSCGNGVFCHSAAAHGEERRGAPASMDFDMLPSPSGLLTMLDRAQSAWQLVRAEEMPPKGSARFLGDGDWTVDVERRPDAARLPALSTHEGKAALRNWLACGAPTVTETSVPSWARPAQSPFGDGGVAPSWTAIYQSILKPRCALSGCHNATGAAGGLALGDECQAYGAMFASGTCRQPYVNRDDVDASLLLDKLESEAPGCGGPMPPASAGGRLPDAMTMAIRAWIEAGAEAEACP